MTNVDRCPPAVSELLSMGLREHLPTLSESVSSDTVGTAAPSDLISVLLVPSRRGVFLDLILLHYQCG